MNPDDDIATVRSYYEAYVKGDKRLLESLLSDDFRFTSPMDNDLDRATYVRVCWPNNRHIHGYDHVHVVAQDGVVFVTYEGRGDRDRRFRNTEVATVRDGKICRIEVYFGWSIPHPLPRGAHEERAPARTLHP